MPADLATSESSAWRAAGGCPQWGQREGARAVSGAPSRRHVRRLRPSSIKTIKSIKAIKGAGIVPKTPVTYALEWADWREPSTCARTRACNTMREPHT